MSAQKTRYGGEERRISDSHHNLETPYGPCGPLGVLEKEALGWVLQMFSTSWLGLLVKSSCHGQL